MKTWECLLRVTCCLAILILMLANGLAAGDNCSPPDPTIPWPEESWRASSIMPASSTTRTVLQARSDRRGPRVLPTVEGAGVDAGLADRELQLLSPRFLATIL